MTDELDTIHQALQSDGYYLDPSLADQFSPQQLEALQSGLAAADQPTYVIVYPFRDSDVYGGSAVDLVARLHQAYPDPGVYLTTTTDLTQAEYDTISLEGRQYDVLGQRDGSLDDYQLLSAVQYEKPPDLGTAFVRAVDLLNAGPEAIEKAYDKAYAASNADGGGGSTGSTGSDGPSGGNGGDGAGFDPTGLVVAVLVLAVLGALGWAAIRRLGRGAARRTPVVLPAAALARIRESQERKRVDEARAAVLALGVAVDQINLSTADKRAGWQAAFDHFQAARDLLESATAGTGEPEPLDVVGVLVIAGRGESALAAARRGRPWEPSTPCFLNPLHGVARERVRLDGGPRGQDVPACADCLAALAAHTEPDMLDVEHRGRVVHYFETDVQPWAATGYGALDTDLLQALGRARG